MKVLKTGFFLLLSSVVAFAAIEGLLFIGDKLSGSPYFDVADPTVFSYPKDPESHVKIGVFGESSARGFAVAASFSDILAHELEGKFSKPLYVKNLAREGSTFHRHSADIARRVMDKLDVVIIYAGHNEMWNVAEDVGHIDVYDQPIHARPAGDTDNEVNRFLRRANHHYTLRDWLQGRSRAFGFAKRLKADLLKCRYRAEKLPRYSRPPLTADRRVVPEAKVKEMSDLFLSDIRDLKKAADEKGVRLILCTETCQLLWPPMFAFRLKPLDAGKQKKFDEALAAGDAAALKKALALDPEHAFANHKLGALLFKERKFNEAWPYLLKAKDNDGWPVRILSSMNDGIRAAVPAKDLADVEKVFMAALEAGALPEDLYLDFQHPSQRGHILIAKTLLSLFPEAVGGDKSLEKLDVALGGGPQSFTKYETELGITARKRQEAADTSFYWLLSLNYYAYNNATFFEYAVRAWDRLNDGESGKYAQARYLAGRAVLLAFTEGIDASQIKSLLDEAAAINRRAVKRVLFHGFRGLPPDDIAKRTGYVL